MVPSSIAMSKEGAVRRLLLVLVKHGIWLVLTVSVCVLSIGCAEAEFDLATESRVPRWFVLPEGLSRSTVRVRMGYYTRPQGGIARFTLLSANGEEIAEVTGSIRDLRPQRRQGQLEGYPTYEVVTANAITEVIEHRGGPVFYVIDDPAVKAELGVSEQ